MAWTSKSNRFTGIKEDSHPAVGPGSYAAPPSIREQEQGYAPFGSYKERPASEKQVAQDSKPERYPVPPPGAYDPKLPGNYDSGLPRKTAPFQSSALRAGPQKVPKEPQPGPGSYQLRTDAARNPEGCRTMGVPQGAQKLMFRSASAPSIPRGQQCYGYEEGGDGRLVRQPPKNVAQLLSGVGAETAGPGQYESGTSALARKAPGGTFGLGPPRGGGKILETPGPGHYMERNSSRRVGALSSLASGTIRLPTRDDETPGPGSYSVAGSGPKGLRELNPELQFFGSTTERVKGTQGNGVPGPGQYEAPGRRGARAPVKTSFGVSDRFEEGALAAQQPGPGAYDFDMLPKTSGVLGTASVLGSTGALAFGSMQSRAFGGPTEVKQETPGPGNYEVSAQPEQAAAMGRLRVGRANPPNAVFASESAKNGLLAATMKQAQDSPPVGTYTPLLPKETAAVMRMPPKSEGFLSTAPRGDSFSKAAASGPGPGRYSPADLTAGKQLGTYNRVVLDGNRGGFGFGHTGKRFADKPAAHPGPGAYQVDHNWVTKSHNVHFGDV